MSNDVNMNRRFPFTSFPNGWFRVAYSNELKPQKVTPLHYFGKDLILLRAEDGIPHVFDAHCPHLGAHLGYGGRVEGNNIRCPFHGWAFNSQGTCINIPYTCKIPQNAQLRCWPVSEVNGLIMVYHHAQGEPPSWKIPELPRWNKKEWTGFNRYTLKIRAHIQEINENDMDTAHFLSLHSQLVQAIKETPPKIDGSVFTYRTFPTYKQSYGSKQVYEAEATQEITSHGLGYVSIYSCIKTITELNTQHIFMITPIDEEYVEYHILCSIKKVFNNVVTHFLHTRSLMETVAVLKQDIPIWENKIYLSHPLLCEGDGPIMQYRRWARQFY